MPKWAYLIEGREERLKKVKALVDRPGTPGEQAAARKAYQRLMAELKKPTGKMAPSSKPRRKAPRVWGPGGMDYEDPAEWQDKLNRTKPLVIRFVSEWSKSKWKRVYDVVSQNGKALLSISDYPSGLNKRLLLMDRSQLGRYGIEFYRKAITDSLLESDATWRKVARDYQTTGSSEDFKRLVATLARTGHLPKGSDTPIGEIENVLRKLGIEKQSPLDELKDAIQNLDDVYSAALKELRGSRHLSVGSYRAIRELASHQRTYRKDTAYQLSVLNREIKPAIETYLHNSAGWIRYLEHGLGPLSSVLIAANVSPILTRLIDGYKRERIAFEGVAVYFSDRRAKLND